MIENFDDKVLKPEKKVINSKYMMRLTERDISLLTDLGRSGVMTYRQIRSLHFVSYISCAKRVRKLQYYEYMSGTYYNTTEKVFVLGKEGINTLKDMTGYEYKQETYENVYHKVMRSELYMNLKSQGISNWTNEVKVEMANSVFDCYFEHCGIPYFCEVHNTQSSKKLREKLERALKIDTNFCLLIYCRNRDVVKKTIENMNKDGFKELRRYAIKVFEYGESVII